MEWTPVWPLRMVTTMSTPPDRNHKLRFFRLATIGGGSLLLAYGLWGLHSGWIISTWMRIEPRGTAAYWITVAALIAMGSVNLVIGLYSLSKD
jgi:hypothetical protein